MPSRNLPQEMSMDFPLGGTLGIYKSIFIHSSSFPLDETIQVTKKKKAPKIA
jgi:hypothetical protein